MANEPATSASKSDLAKRREWLAAAASLALVLGTFIWMACGFTITQMGGEPERGADGSFILNNHGRIASAGRMGWQLARCLHWAAFIGAGVCIFAALVFALWRTGTPGTCDQDFLRTRRPLAWVFVLALAVLLAWGAILSVTPLAGWLRPLE